MSNTEKTVWRDSEATKPIDDVNVALKATGNTSKLEKIHPVYLSNKT